MVQNTQSNFQSVLSDIFFGENSKRSDDFSVETFTNNSLQTGVTDRENIEIVDCKYICSDTALLYKFQDSRNSFLDCYKTNRDIIEQTVLTIDSEEPKSIFHLILVSDNICSSAHLCTSCISKIMVSSREQKQSIIKYCGSQTKSKRRPYSLNENFLLIKLKEQEKLTWGKITAYCPDSKDSSLQIHQIHYSTKLTTALPAKFGRGPRSIKENKRIDSTVHARRTKPMIPIVFYDSSRFLGERSAVISPSRKIHKFRH